MNCMESQELITKFINNELGINKLAFFLDHIKSCEICREELEVYYTLLTAMQQLDNDKELSNNYSEELRRKIQYWDDRIRRQRMQKVRRRFIFLFMIIGMGMLFGIELGGKILEEPEETQEIRIVPSFRLSFSGVPAIMEFADAFIEEYDDEAKRYVEGRRMLREYIWRSSYIDTGGRLKFINKKEDGGSHGKYNEE